ncbi:MAG: 2-oxo acid dehydrogenase subunit E2 [Spirochaetes bacterium]|nr:2-oxo acid dehydrogenase subunit E2 [Spirochaetota bacterium]MBU1079759.1 2-oxo acid dehydrogenase subunit E2 [Spirochaetota bacterium]
MLKKTRPDATLIRDLPDFTRFMPFLMPNKGGSIINYEQDLDVTETLELIRDVNRELIKEREILTLFGVVINAAVRALAMRPKLNRFISGYRFWQRNQILINFVAKKELTDDGQEVNVKIEFSPYETLATTARKVRGAVKRAVSEEGADNESVVTAIMRLPDFLVRLLVRGMDWLDQHNLMPRALTDSDPMWCSVFMTNVGSFGLDAPYHHLFERGNCPVFVAMGRVRDERSLDDSGRVIVRKMVRLRYTFDDRIADGVYMGRALDLMQRFVERAGELIEPPILSPEIVAELRLRDYPAGV